MKRRERRAKETKRRERRRRRTRGGKRRRRGGGDCQVSLGVWAALTPFLNLFDFCVVFVEMEKKG